MNVAVMGCKNIKDETCIGCQRCLTAFDRKEGEFERYKDELLAVVTRKAGIEVVEGSHPYVPMNVYGA